MAEKTVQIIGFTEGCLKCFMHLLFRCLPTLNLHTFIAIEIRHILALQIAYKLHWSSDVSARSRSISINLPVRSAELIFDFVTIGMTPLQPLTASSSSSHLSELSGNEVGLRDDALHFVICRICCGLVVTDGHFVSVSL